MRLITYEYFAQGRTIQAVGVVDPATNNISEQPQFGDMISLIKSGFVPFEFKGEVNKTIPLDTVKLVAPILSPPKNVLCVGINYRDHVAEGAKVGAVDAKLPQVPVFFSKPHTCIIGHKESIMFDPQLTETIDWEGELGVVIGKRGVDITEEEALNYVFGYTCINDVSARQFAHGQWFKGKSLDTFCPIGPWIVTADEVKDPQDLRLQLRVNGVVKQDASTAQMIFNIKQLIASLSQSFTLEPGDIIATGTPSGVGFARTPPEFLRDGDLVEVEIEKIGTLSNPVVKK